VIEARGARGDSRAIGKTTTEVPVTLALQSLGSIAGQVLIGDTPVTHYDVGCFEYMGELHRVDSADGTFLVKHLEPGSYVCTAITDTDSVTAKVKVTVGLATVQLRIARGVSVVGSAVNVLTGEPMPGLRVHAGDDPIDDPSDPTTDANGAFLIERAPLSGSLRFYKRGVYSSSGAAEFAAQEGQRVDVGRVRLVPIPSGAPGDLGLRVRLEEPVVISEVVEGGAANHAGLQRGDRIDSYDGVLLAGLPHVLVWRLVMFSASAGEPVRLGLASGATVTIVPSER